MFASFSKTNFCVRMIAVLSVSSKVAVNDKSAKFKFQNIVTDIGDITKYIETGSFSMYLNGLIDPEITRHFLRMRFVSFRCLFE